MEKLKSARWIANPFSGSLDPVTLISKLFIPVALRDRFNVLNKYSPIRWVETVDEIPDASKSIYSFEEIMDIKAKEIIALNRNITLVWSGGVDSTALVVAILRNLDPKEYSRICIYGTYYSIKEYHWFYDFLVKLGIRVRITDLLTEEIEDEDGSILLSGWCADQLFGSDIHLRDKSLYNVPWLEGISKHWELVTKTKLNNKTLNIIDEIYQSYANNILNIKLDKFCQFAWMFNFCFKWSAIEDQQRHIFAKSITNLDDCLGFFDDIRFQHWSRANYDNLVSYNPLERPHNYKRDLKQYILNYTKDQEYFNTKSKENSWIRNADVNALYVSCITDQGHKIYSFKDHRDCGHCIMKLQEKARQNFLK